MQSIRPSTRGWNWDLKSNRDESHKSFKSFLFYHIKSLLLTHYFLLATFVPISKTFFLPPLTILKICFHVTGFN